MKPSPLHLEGYFLKDLAVEINPKFNKKADVSAWIGFHYQLDSSFQPDPVTFGTAGSIAVKKDDPLSRYYELTLTSDKSPRKKFPYYFRITVAGYFKICKGYPEERAELLFHANAPAMLYAAAREILATVTGRGPFPAIILPAVSFLDDAEKLAADAARELNSTKQVRKLPGKKASKGGVKKRAK